jgi:cyclase
MIKKIIPCLDIRDGKVVKGINFEGIREVGDPVERAKLYIAQGADELVLYDIGASVNKRIIDLELVRQVADLKGSIPLTVAGGISSVEDFRRALAAGADSVSINSPAIRNPDLIKQSSDKYGKAAVVIGIDATRYRNIGIDKDGYAVMLGAGKVDSGLDLLEWARRVDELGAGTICLNSIDADGTKAGYDTEMLCAVSGVTALPLIASGGCGKLGDFAEVFSKTSSYAALAASVFHNDELTVKAIKEYLIERGVEGVNL